MKSDRFGIFLVAASLALAALVVALSVQNRRLKSELAACEAGHGGVPADALSEGDVLPPIPVVGPDGEETTIAFDADRTVLLVFSSTCPACRETWPHWNRIAAEAAEGARLFAIRTDAPRPEVPEAGPAAHAVPIFVYRRGDDHPLKGVYAVPCAVVVSRGGKAESVVFGVPDARALETLRRAVAS